MSEYSILFTYKDQSGDFHIESMRGTSAGSCFRIESIPLFTPSVSKGDIVSVVDDENAYHFEMVIDPSGNSTIQVSFFDETLMEPFFEYMQGMGCDYEASFDKKMVAVNIPFDVQYSMVQDYFEKGEEEGNWTYKESNQMHH
jgi:hypothetical protein